MSKRVYAPVNPDILIWARKSVGYDIPTAAKKVGISNPSRLEKFEKGIERPTTNQLLKMARIYDCPFAAFFFAKTPNQLKYELKGLKDWRKLPGSEPRVFSPELIIELRLAMRRRDILIDVADEMREEIPRFVVAEPEKRDHSTAIELAGQVRAQLGISVLQQKRFGNVYNALRKWRNAVEKLEVIVSQTGLRFSISTEEMRGVTISYDRLPIILLNGRDSPNARIFTLMHELGHLVLREGGISNVYESRSSSSSEAFCNEFAGELLVPRNALQGEPTVKANNSETWEDTDLEKLSRNYRVSKEVILLRLLSIGRTSRDHYLAQVKKWKQEWEEEQASRDNGIGAFRPPHEKYVRNHGARFVSTILEGYGREVLHAGQLSDYLGAKLHYVPDIIRDLSRVTA